MKKFTKLLGIVLIIALVMSMGTMALADDPAPAASGSGAGTETGGTSGSGEGTGTGGSTTPATTATIKIGSTGTEGHTYKVFQIFTGEAGTANGELINLKYGQNITGTGREAGKAVSQADLANILADLEYTARNVDDVEELATLTQFVDLTDSNAFASLTGSGTATVPTGYYLIKDQDNSLVDENGNPLDDAYTLYLMSVIKAGETYTIEPKASVPEVEKKVKDVNDSAEASTTNPTDWQDSADHDIGDVIDYKITGTLPSTFADYNSYTTYTFTDTLSNGLTITEAQLAALTIKVNGTTDVKDWFSVNLNEQVLTISLKANTDLKKVAYGTSNTKLTANDKIVVEYKATLNENAVIGAAGNPNTVDLEFTNNPNVNGTGTGKTPEDKVIVFTYKTTVDKVDPDGKALTGADFALYKEVPQGTTGAETGANIKKNWNTNVKSAAAALADAKYYVVAGQKTAANSQFKFEGIDDGTYVLVETTVPTGYNAWEATEFTVTADHDVTADNPALTSLTSSDPFTTNATDGWVKPQDVTKKDGSKHTTVSGELYTEIENNSGTVLPSTGGIGTTIFYVVGSIMVVAAGVLLITKKRMGRE